MLTDEEIITRLKKEAAVKATPGVLQTSNGLYIEGECIGSGNQGKVYKGKYYRLSDGQLHIIDPVAIKESAGGDVAKLAFEHDCLKKIYPDGHHDIVSEGDHTYVVMPFIKGDSLASFIEAQHELSLVERVELVFNLFQALCACHEKGIAHLDLKDQNILIDSATKTVNIIDFGSALKLGQLIRFKNIETTPFDFEIPPEYLHGTLTTTTLDCYSITLRVAEILGLNKVKLIQNRVEKAFESLFDPMKLKEDILVAVQEKRGLGDAFYHPRLRTKWSSPLVKKFLKAYVDTPYDFSVYSHVLDDKLIDMLNGLQCQSPDDRFDMSQCLALLDTFLKTPGALKSPDKTYCELHAREVVSSARLVSSFSSIIKKERGTQRMPFGDMSMIEEEEEEEEEAVVGLI